MSDPTPISHPAGRSAVPSAPELLGYRCGEVVASDAHCTQWAARGPSQEPVVVRRYRLPASTRVAAERRLRLLQRSPHPRCLPVHAVERTGGGVVAAVGTVAGCDLTTLLTRHGGLTAGGLERLTHGLAGALSHLHHHGVRAGDLDTDHVTLDAGGRPMLDLPVAGPSAGSTDSAAAAAWGERDDLASLARLVARVGRDEAGDGEPMFDPDLARVLDRAASGGEDAPTLAHVIEAASAAIERREALVRAGAASATDHLQAIADLAAASVREHVLAAPTRERARSRWWRWRWQVATVVAGALVGFTGAAALSTGSATAVGEGVPSQSMSVQTAFRLRDEALMAGSLPALSRAVSPGSPAWSHDRALGAAIEARGIQISGLRTRVRAADGQFWVQQMPHVRWVVGQARLIPAQPVYCLRIRTDERGRLAQLENCEPGSPR